jgi:hypothetical protein
MEASRGQNRMTRADPDTGPASRRGGEYPLLAPRSRTRPPDARHEGARLSLGVLRQELPKRAADRRFILTLPHTGTAGRPEASPFGGDPAKAGSISG